MPSYSFMRVTTGLKPDGEAAYEALKKIKEGSVVRVEIHSMRSPAQLRCWWALIGKAFDNLPEEMQRHYGDKQGLHAAVLCHLGFCVEMIRRPQGGTETLIQRPKSIALGNMDATEFNELFDRASDLLAKTLGVTPDSLRSEAMA